MSNAEEYTEDHVDLLGLTYKNNRLIRVKNSPNWYRSRYCPVKQDNIKNTLGTPSIDDAWKRFIFQIDAGEPLPPDSLPDPKIIDVIELYVQDPDRRRSWEKRMSTLREVLSAHLPYSTVSTFKGEAQVILLKHLATRMNTATIQGQMKLIRAALRWVCSESVFQARLCPLTPPPLIMSIPDIRKVTKGAAVKPRNEHPTREQMATFLAHLVKNGQEDLRRFAIIALATAGRPGACTAVKSDQLNLEYGLLDLLQSSHDQIENKIKATVPLPISVLNEIASWETNEDGRYVGIEFRTIDNQMRAIKNELNIPHLMPSAIRDFMATQMRSAGGRFAVPSVPKEQIKRWMGHKDRGVHEDYGIFEREASHLAVIAVEHILNELDTLSQGAIYRSKATVWSLPPNLRQVKEDCDEESGYPPRITNQSALTELPWALGNLVGRKTGMTVVIEGYQGRFREISAYEWPDFEDGKIDDSPEYLLSHIYRWFEFAGIEIYDQDPTTVVSGRPIRLFTHQEDDRIMSIDTIAEMMVRELGHDPGGWRDPLQTKPGKAFISKTGPYEDLYESLAVYALLERREAEQRERSAKRYKAYKARRKAKYSLSNAKQTC